MRESLQNSLNNAQDLEQKKLEQRRYYAALFVLSISMLSEFEQQDNPTRLLTLLVMLASITNIIVTTGHRAEAKADIQKYTNMLRFHAESQQEEKITETSSLPSACKDTP